jgi:hypothetical protein
MTTDPVEALAERLAQQGFGTYCTAQAYVEPERGIVFDFQPAVPSRVLVLTTYAGPEADSLLPYDTPRVQIMSRDDNPAASRQLLKSIYNDLHGLGPITISEVRFILVIAIGSGPTYVGRDDNKRHLHALSVELTVHNPNRRGLPA